MAVKGNGLLALLSLIKFAEFEYVLMMVVYLSSELRGQTCEGQTGEGRTCGVTERRPPWL